MSQLQLFNYQDLDANTATLLKEKESTIRTATGNAATIIGQQLKEAQDALANHKTGMFEKWYESLGFKRQTVYKLIERYEYILHNVEELNLDTLPLSLSYEISKPSAPADLVQKVINGDITTNKEYQQALRDKKLAEAKAEQLQAELQMERNKKPLEKEVLPADYHQAKQALSKMQAQQQSHVKQIEELNRQVASYEKQAQLNARAAKELLDMKKQMRQLTEQKNELGRRIDAATSLSGLIVGIDAFIKEKLAPVKYSRAINEVRDDEIVQRNLIEIVERVQAWIDEMWTILRGENAIDIGGN